MSQSDSNTIWIHTQLVSSANDVLVLSPLSHLALSTTTPFSIMSEDQQQPFIGSRAFNKANSAYVSFPSQADAMLASLQLFHDIPCRFMDLFFSVVTHPDFDAKQVTLRDSVDVINIVEESRLKDRMAVVHKRAHGADGHTKQAGFPQFVLYEVLDIIHAERMVNVKKWFEKSLSNEEMYRESITVPEDDIFKSLAHVHRTWTWPAQKAFGRVFFIGRPVKSNLFDNVSMEDLLYPIRKSIFGPWTSVVAIQLFHPVKVVCSCSHSYESYTEYEYDDIVRESYSKWFETLHRILVGFTRLKSLYVKSYSLLFTEWATASIDVMLCQNTRLEEVLLYGNNNNSDTEDWQYILDLLEENNWTIGEATRGGGILCRRERN